MKPLLLFLLTLSSFRSFCQFTPNEIDSLIDQQHDKTTLIITRNYFPDTNIYVSHGPLDSVFMEFRYIKKNPVEISIKWYYIDTGQVTTYYFKKEKLIKVLTKCKEWRQYAYMNRNHEIASGDSEGGTNPNIKSDYKRSRRYFKMAKTIQQKISK